MNKHICSTVILVMFALASSAKMVVHVGDPKQQGSKTLLKVHLKNGFAEPVESARATIFLFGADNKVVAKETCWIIGGGGRDRKPLEPGAEGDYYFVLKSDKPFSRSEFRLNQLLLKGGKSVNPKDAYTIE